MIAEEYLRRSRLFRRLKSGPPGQLAELYATRLVKDGLARQGTWRCLSLAGDLLSWMARSRAQLTDLDERRIERYLRHRARKQSLQQGDRAALKRLLSVLREAGTIAPTALPPTAPPDQIFEEFGDYLRRERGLAPKSIIRHLPIIRRFLRVNSHPTVTPFSRPIVTPVGRQEWAYPRSARGRSLCTHAG